jgi:hypothetical protein
VSWLYRRSSREREARDHLVEYTERPFEPDEIAPPDVLVGAGGGEKATGCAAKLNVCGGCGGAVVGLPQATANPATSTTMQRLMVGFIAARPEKKKPRAPTGTRGFRFERD